MMMMMNERPGQTLALRQGQNLVLTVLYVPCSLDSVTELPPPPRLQGYLTYKKTHPPRTLQ